MSLCSACAGVSSLKCGVCGTPYCSTTCQRRAWRGHRKACRDFIFYRVSPGFLLASSDAGGVARSVPLLACTAKDGLGGLSVSLGYSGHLGLAMLEEDAKFFNMTPAELASDEALLSAALWAVMSIPLRSGRALPLTCFAVHPKKGRREAEALISAGLARWRPDIAAEPAGYYEGGAPILELLDVASWRELNGLCPGAMPWAPKGHAASDVGCTSARCRFCCGKVGSAEICPVHKE